ncbi:thioesterase domain-containing protein [Streptomyces sp. MS1.HAVA.3]|uniref:Thioesterase domain-containing protein n=1 Tax=Streptomyces caledonius TaxID=3134107 RepID=A0ABU8U1Q2_9ACTN
MPRNPWFPYPVREGALHIVCLPHAGAGASSYRSWASTAPEGLSVCPVQPPGREGRGAEAAYDDVAAFVRDLAPVLLDTVPRPFALFGHSTGALTAYELARELRRLGAPMPRHLFVAGRRAPHIPMPRTNLGNASVDTLRKTLRKLGGTPEAVLEQDGLLRHLQPLLAADFHLNESYEFPGDEPLDVPITAFPALHDSGAGVAEMGPWNLHTTSDFNQLELDGGHFAVFDQAARVQAHMMKQAEPSREQVVR